MKGVATAADGVAIHYEVHGEGRPVLVFVHGFSCDRSYWANQVNDLDRDFQVVTVDLAGHGESGLNRKSWSMAAFGEDVVAVVEQLGLEQIVLIGHSMSGYVIVEAARRMPQKVIGLIAVETFQDLLQTRTREEIDELLAPLRSDFVATVRDAVRSRFFIPTSDPALVETISEDMAAAPPDVAIPVADSMFRYAAQLREGLQEVEAPIVLINSDYRPTNISAAERYGIAVEMLSGAGHFLMMEIPETFNRRLQELVVELTDRKDLKEKESPKG